MKNNRILNGIFIMIFSSLLTCTGQLIWKLSALQAGETKYVFYVLGFALYGFGALAMMIAFRFGELSVLHPMLSAGYIVSIFLAYFVLNEEITVKRIAGIFLIILGMCFLGRAGLESSDE